VGVLEELLGEVLASTASSPRWYPSPPGVATNDVVREVGREFIKLSPRREGFEHLVAELEMYCCLSIVGEQCPGLKGRTQCWLPS